MHPFAVLSVLFLSTCAGSSSLSQLLEKRDSYTGQATYFTPGLGACGWFNSDSDPVVALSSDMYAGGQYCGQWITVTNTANQETVSIEVVDLCPGCPSYDIDMSSSSFQQIADYGLDEGVLMVTWSFD